MSDEQEIKVRRRRVFHLHKKKRSYLTKNEDRVNLVPRYEDDRIKNTGLYAIGKKRHKITFICVRCQFLFFVGVIMLRKKRRHFTRTKRNMVSALMRIKKVYKYIFTYISALIDM